MKIIGYTVQGSFALPIWQREFVMALKEYLYKTIKRILFYGDQAVHFSFADAPPLLLYHDQDCCESVWLEAVVGEVKDLLGSPLLVAEERTQYYDASPDSYGDLEYTFYEFATVKGSLNLCWRGESNGYYSTSVDIAVGEETLIPLVKVGQQYASETWVDKNEG